MSAAALVLALGLAACGGETAPPSPNSETSEGAGGETAELQPESDVDDGASGTLTLDGDELALENLLCARNDELATWGFTADVAGGGFVLLSAFGSASVTFDDAEWSNRTGEEFEQLDHSGDGISGQNTMNLVGSPAHDPTLVALTADIAC